MSFVILSQSEEIATVTLQRGKVNALNEPTVDELTEAFQNLEKDRKVESVVLTGSGKFFSFGFDVPEFLGYAKKDFIRYLEKFANLYTYVFQFPKPVVASLNGHTIAGGCMLAIACDYRLMVSGKPKISLNEITFGSSVFAGSAEILRFCVGARNAQAILYSGAMYSAEEAFDLGLVDQVASEDLLVEDATGVARELALRNGPAFRSIKNLLRRPVVEEIMKSEKDSLIEMVDIWYSEPTRKNLRKIKIY
ncbi:MAG: enoyl-CoA hydratase/isomerase family protein [Deltaproteobacteria bacterium]|nr:MAG: enoyl-CoA hydratase/isomerase family protein [Deltaproteobacteria bacterium]